MTFRFFVALAINFSALVVYPSFARSQEAPPDRKNPVAECRKSIKNPDGYREFEEYCLSSLKEVVDKADNAIRVKLRDGTTKSFKNSKACQDGNSDMERILYHLRDYFSQNDLVVIDRWLHIGPSSFRTGSYMVDRGTGRVIDLPDNAHFSPDGTRFVAVSACYDHCANRIDIWSIKDRPAKLEWRHRIKQGEESYYYKFQNWENDGRINIRIFPETPAEDDAGRDFDENKYSDAAIHLDVSGWKIEKLINHKGTPAPNANGKSKN